MQTQLEQNVHDTAAAVRDCKDAIDAISARLDTALTALAKSKHEADVLRAKASTGCDAAASAAFKAAHDAQRAAESTIDEIRRVTMPKAVSQLAEVEREANNARRTAARPHIEALKRGCVDDAAQIDEALAIIKATHERRLLRVQELQTWESDDGMVSRLEDRIGFKRIYSALPACLRSLPTNPTAPFIPLAQSERQFWSLPPEQPEEKAA